MTLTVLIAALAASATSEFAQTRKAWSLQPADHARPGLWRARGGANGATLLVRIDTTAVGEIVRWEWSAEIGPRETDLPEDAFWSILDGIAQGREWIETDPDALPSKSFTAPTAQLAQGFRCPSCRPPLVAATWSPHGGTRLLISRSESSRRAPTIDVAEFVTEDGIRSLLRQQGLSLESSNPCKGGDEACTLEAGGARGEHWVFSRDAKSRGWHLAEATFPGPPWWNPEWDWDSLRIESPREFRLMLKNWLDAEIDVDGARLLRPIESILGASVSDWTSRSVRGLDPGPAIDRLAKASTPPSAIVICETPEFRLSVDTFGRRRLEVLRGALR